MGNAGNAGNSCFCCVDPPNKEFVVVKAHSVVRDVELPLLLEFSADGLTHVRYPDYNLVPQDEEAFLGISTLLLRRRVVVVAAPMRPVLSSLMPVAHL